MTRRQRAAPDAPAVGAASPGRVFLDWRTHKLGTRPGKCRLCGRPTLLRDEKNRPCHKVCAEADAERQAAQAAARYQSQGRRE